MGVEIGGLFIWFSMCNTRMHTELKTFIVDMVTYDRNTKSICPEFIIVKSYIIFLLKNQEYKLAEYEYNLFLLWKLFLCLKCCIIWEKFYGDWGRKRGRGVVFLPPPPFYKFLYHWYIHLPGYTGASLFVLEMGDCCLCIITCIHSAHLALFSHETEAFLCVS